MATEVEPISILVDSYRHNMSSGCDHDYKTIAIYGGRNQYGPGLHMAQELKRCSICKGYTLLTWKTNQWYESYIEP